MENMNQRTAFAVPAFPVASVTTRGLELAGATVADIRTVDVRTAARVAPLPGTGASICAAKRVRATGTATDMRHTGFPAYVPGSIAWSPPT